MHSALPSLLLFVFNKHVFSMCNLLRFFNNCKCWRQTWWVTRDVKAIFGNRSQKQWLEVCWKRPRESDGLPTAIKSHVL